VFDPAALFEWTYRGAAAPMHPRYLAELAQMRRATPSTLAGGLLSPPGATVGDRVRLRGRGKYADLVGQVEARGRTRFRVRTELGLVSAPFALVERLQP
jgi:hypothetical protein